MDMAKVANSPKIWVEVYKACLSSKEFSKAAVAGLNVIIHPDHLEELIQ